MMKNRVCAQCDGAEGIFRPVQLHENNLNRLWACSGECAEALETHLDLAYRTCHPCDGSGVRAELGPCDRCDGKGLVPR